MWQINRRLPCEFSCVWGQQSPCFALQFFLINRDLCARQLYSKDKVTRAKRPSNAWNHIRAATSQGGPRGLALRSHRTQLQLLASRVSSCLLPPRHIALLHVPGEHVLGKWTSAQSRSMLVLMLTGSPTPPPRPWIADLAPWAEPRIKMSGQKLSVLTASN